VESDDDDDKALIIALATGDVVIELLPEVAPLHVERIETLAQSGQYDNVAFHRVLDGFVAQTGDVQYGDLEDGYDPARVGTGGSALDDLPLEPSQIAFERGVVGMARSSDPDSANSQFFIMFEAGTFLDGAYTVFGRVTEGMDLVDDIKRGDPPSGRVTDPDRMFDVGIDEIDEDEGLDAEDAQDIALLWEAGLGRQAAYIGLNFWIDRFEDLSDEISDVAALNLIAQSFLRSDEFAENVGDPNSLTNTQFVDALFFNVIGREPAETGRDFWTDKLEEGASRAAVLRAFATIDENAQKSPEVFTLAPIGDGDGPDRDPDDALRQDFEAEWDFGG